MDQEQRGTDTVTICDAFARPVIALTPDFREANAAFLESEFSIRANYIDAVVEAGGVPVIFPMGLDDPASALGCVAGVIVTGTLPGEQASARRRAFELELIRHALATGKPLLGICNGMQLIGEALGGSVLRDMPGLAGEVTPHIPHAIPDRLAHDILIETGTLLGWLSGQPTVRVNSLHRHALDMSGRYRVAARSPDGIVEAIEGLGDTFCMGVQWHPEYGLTPLDRAIFSAFVARCSNEAGDTV